MDVGAVGGLVHCKEAVLTARRVLEHTQHSLLVGLQATEFAVEMGLPLSNLSTTQSREIWHDWYFARSAASDSPLTPAIQSKQGTSQCLQTQLDPLRRE